MSKVTENGGPTAPRQPSAFQRWRAWKLRWVSLGSLAVVAAGIVLGVTLTSGGAAAAPAVGSMAPAGSFTTVSGQTESLSSLRGQPTLVWLVTTWCPVCQAGTHAMTSGLASQLARKHVHVLELEIYGDLGHPKPSMTAFVQKYAGAGPHGADWTFGTASSALTQAYNPKGVMDIYYLVNSAGRITYVNSGPAATGPKLLAHAAALS